MEITLAAIGLTLGMITSRVETIGSRSNIERQSSIFAIISFLSMVSTFSMIGWGFYFLEWWMPILAFVVVSIFNGLCINRSTFSFFYALSPLTGSAAIAATLSVWVISLS